MKKMMIALLALAVSMAVASVTWAGPFEHYYDYMNPDGTFAYYFDQGSGVFVTLDQNWYQHTFVKTSDRGATFYHRDSYLAYEEEGVEGGRLFTLGASVNTGFRELPSFEYIGFDEESAMNYYAELPSDYQAYMEDESIRAEYDALWEGVKDVIAGISIGPEEEESNPVYLPDDKKPEILKSGDYSYWIRDGKEAVLADYSGDEEVVEIPSEIDGYTVTKIGDDAFSQKEMKCLIFPDSISEIGERAFEYCTITDELQFSENAVIGRDAFSYAKLPPSLMIPAGVTVEECAFSYCDTLETVLTGPDAVIRGRAFGYCDNLVQVVCADGGEMQDDSFEYCRSLESVILCGSVSVEEDAFPYCGDAKISRAEENEFDAWKEGDSDFSESDTSSAEPVPEGGLNTDADGNLSGGWEVTESSEITDEERAIFNQAVQGITDVAYDPVALLATQVVAGKNYCFLARESSYNLSEKPSYELVYVWQAPGESAKLLEMQEIEFGLKEQ